MAIDDRVRQGSQRSMSAIDTDVERHLRDARRRGHRRLVMRRATAILAVAASVTLVAIAGPGLRDLLRDQERQPATPPAPSPVLLSGTWRMTYTCEKIERAFERAGVGELATHALVAIGVQDGYLARSSDPCRGAEKVERTVVFRSHGSLLRYQGEKLVDDCRCYRLKAAQTFVSLGDGGVPDITLRYRIDGDALTFDAVMPDRCSTTRCRNGFAFALAQYAVGTWRRVNP